MHRITKNNRFVVTPCYPTPGTDEKLKWNVQLTFYSTPLEEKETVGFEDSETSTGHAYSWVTYKGLSEVVLSTFASTPSGALEAMWAICEDISAWEWNA